MVYDFIELSFFTKTSYKKSSLLKEGIQVKKFFARFSQKNLTDLKINFAKFELYVTFHCQDMTI